MHESDELTSAFVELEAIVRESSRLPGLAAAQVEARRRRGRQTAWMAGAIVLVVLAGVAAVLDGRLLGNRQPALQPSPSVTADPTPSPSVTTTTPPTPSGAVLADLMPPARIRNATLDVPAFDLDGCPSGRIQFLDMVFGSVSSGGLLVMDVAAVGDVDADGEEDVVLGLECSVPSGNHSASWTQVLAYSGPELTLLPALADGAGTKVTDLLVHADGEVELGLASVSSPRTQVLSIAFDRYQWSGSGFERIDHVDVPQEGLPGSEVTAEPPLLALAPGGPPQRVEVIVRNDRPTSPWPFRLDVTSAAPVSIEVEGFASTAAGPLHRLLITSPEAGEVVTIVLRVALPAGATLPADSLIMAMVWGSYPANENPAMIPLIPA